MAKLAKKRNSCSVLAVRKLTDSTAVLRVERLGLDFEPGQYVRVGIGEDLEMRDYSVYSAAEADYLEILVRRVEEGYLSKRLFELAPGDSVGVVGPYGHFRLTEEVRSKPVLLVATGTGISPYHSFALSYPELNYRLIHGTSVLEEAYEPETYGGRYFHCVSREADGDFSGRVTDYLKTLEVPVQTHAFLCGNCDMIYDAFDLLQDKGLPTEQIHTEVYF